MVTREGGIDADRRFAVAPIECRIQPNIGVANHKSARLNHNSKVDPRYFRHRAHPSGEPRNSGVSGIDIHDVKDSEQTPSDPIDRVEHVIALLMYEQRNGKLAARGSCHRVRYLALLGVGQRAAAEVNLLRYTLPKFRDKPVSAHSHKTLDQADIDKLNSRPIFGIRASNQSLLARTANV